MTKNKIRLKEVIEELNRFIAVMERDAALCGYFGIRSDNKALLTASFCKAQMCKEIRLILAGEKYLVLDEEKMMGELEKEFKKQASEVG